MDVFLSENVGCLGKISHSRLQAIIARRKGLAEFVWPRYAFMASGSLAEAEAIFELRLPLTMLFRIVRSLKNSSYRAKLS
jgi:hypothetical protein